MEKLLWKVKNKIEFADDVDFLETILTTAGVKDIDLFLNPTKKSVNDPFLLKNMKEGIKLLHDNLGKNIFIKVDPDADGFTSASFVRQFIERIDPSTNVKYRLNFNKKHGLYYEDVAGYDDLDLIIVPDASLLAFEGEQIKKNLNVPILILDHHEIEEENKAMHDYATVINCTDGQYPNPCLSGVGVVLKFFEAYCKEYKIDPKILDDYMDLVSTGLIADAMNAVEPENRYYMLEGLKEKNFKNEFLNELHLANEDDMSLGRTILSTGWVLAPKINGSIRYGKEEEQINLFRAICGEQEEIEYQPRRKHKIDPKPDIQIHSLQKTMARVCGNIKSRQDTEVRKFMNEIDDVIVQQGLDKNSVIIVDGTDVLTKSTITGLVANKIASKYKRPVLILKAFKTNLFGGSGRGYEKGNIENFKDILEETGAFSKLGGHQNAFGIELEKDRVQEVVDYCNEKINIDDLCTVHEVDYEIEANKLTETDVKMVANNYKIWGNSVPEPLFAIKNLRLISGQIEHYGDNNSMLRFTYNGIPFIKKYCSKTDYPNMICRLNGQGFNTGKKPIVLNIIGKFVLNKWEDKVYPQVRIEYFDSAEDTESNVATTISKSKTTVKKTSVNDDDDFIF